jgi:hypothetical protein
MIIGMRGIPDSCNLFLMNTKRKPLVSVVMKSHTKKSVASRKNSNEPVAIKNAL